MYRIKLQEKDRILENTVQIDFDRTLDYKKVTRKIIIEALREQLGVTLDNLEYIYRPLSRYSWVLCFRSEFDAASLFEKSIIIMDKQAKIEDFNKSIKDISDKTQVSFKPF